MAEPAPAPAPPQAEATPAAPLADAGAGDGLEAMEAPIPSIIMAGFVTGLILLILASRSRIEPNLPQPQPVAR
jgi:hypothetical protein